MRCRGVISSPTRLSPSAKTRSTSCRSSSAKTPASAPLRTIASISSSVTGGSSDLRMRNSRITLSVDQLRSLTTGVATTESACIGLATTVAIRSGCVRAMRLGTISPSTSVRYVIPTTTMASATSSP